MKVYFFHGIKILKRYLWLFILTEKNVFWALITQFRFFLWNLSSDFWNPELKISKFSLWIISLHHTIIFFLEFWVNISEFWILSQNSWAYVLQFRVYNCSSDFFLSWIISQLLYIYIYLFDFFYNLKFLFFPTDLTPDLTIYTCKIFRVKS